MEQKVIQRQDEFLSQALTVDAIVGQQKLVKDVMAKVMKKDQHYGIVPGCKKPSLWKPGAEILCVTFRLSPVFKSETLIDGKHMTVRTVCTLTHIPSGQTFGTGEGLCTTREKKYRLRKDQGRVVENNELEDCWNTVVKMANKRALVSAVLVVTGASEIFTQDMAEDEEPLVVVDTDATVKDTPKETAPEKKEEPKQTTASTAPDAEVWFGKIESIQPQELPSGAACWEIKGDDKSLFKTDIKKWADLADKAGNNHVEITYKLNSKKTRVIQSVKTEATNG